jgi:CO/xanthine dehydrogenase Mo-binding subunit
MLPADLKANPRLDRWVRFDPQGTVTVFSGKVELGQGVVTAIAQIAAEELDVALSRVAMVAGDTSRSPDEGFTSGSQSMELGGTAMRAACAEVRRLFIEAAARRLEVNPAELEVRDGSIGVPGTDHRTDYWALAKEVDLARDATGEAAPKSSSLYAIVGKRVPRLDLPAKLTGAAYVQDMELPGMLHGRALRPPTYGSRLESFAAEAVDGLPGVVAVVVDGSFVGICAEREEQALKALDVAQESARWTSSRLPSPAEAKDLLPALAHQATTLISKDSGKERGGRRLEAAYSRPYIAHASIGPSCAVASFEKGKLTVWSHTQGSFQLRDEIALVLGMAKEDVTVIHRDGAGCYGHNGADDAALDAALLARACGRPVRVQWSREDELAWSPFGSAMAVKVSAALDAGGKVVDWRQEVWSHPHTARPGRGPGVNLLAAWHLGEPKAGPTPRDPPFPPGGGARNAVPLYEFPSCEVTYRQIGEPVLRVSSLRSLGAHANVFAIESFMDELAHAAGADPVEFRLRHLADARAKAVIEAVARSAGWRKDEKGDGARGRGIAFARYKNSSAYCAVVAEVEVAEKVRLRRVHAAVDAGLPVNPDGIRNQVEGGIVQAASWTLKEQVRWTAEGIASRTWDDYPILGFDEAPEVDVTLIESGENPLGTGECAAGPAAAAIANAVFNALGVRARHMPLTPERIAGAME